jgi:hypothetical protein
MLGATPKRSPEPKGHGYVLPERRENVRLFMVTFGGQSWHFEEASGMTLRLA